jgi:hypothetical protein
MPNTQRTPPKSPKVSGSRSESDLSTVIIGVPESDTNITTRYKRQRKETSSPQKSSSPTFSYTNDLRLDLLNMLTGWKEDQERRLSEWKSSLDDTLSELVKEVSHLKMECLEIKKSNAEVEKGMEFMNKTQEEISNKVKEIEKDKNSNSDAIKNLETQIQDLHFQTRHATLEIRNIPCTVNENFDNLLSTVSKIGTALEFTIHPGDIRDIYRLPGKPGVPRPIVAEFACVLTKNEFQSRIRKFNKDKAASEKLNTTTIGLQGEKKPVYIDEYLAPSRRKLMFETRLLAKKFNYSCWHSNGRIFLRIEPNSKPIVVLSEKCLTGLTKTV